VNVENFAGFGLRGFNEPVSLLRKEDFELKLELNLSATAFGLNAKVFTESLILAQDERWRRA
jgi:hypothetical protein